MKPLEVNTRFHYFTNAELVRYLDDLRSEIGDYLLDEDFLHNPPWYNNELLAEAINRLRRSDA